MGQNNKCKVCKSPRRKQIEEALRMGASPRTVAELIQHEISYRTIDRHREKHMAKVVGEDGEETLPPVEVEGPLPLTADDVIDTLEDIDRCAARLFEKALEMGEFAHADAALASRRVGQKMIVDIATMAAFGPQQPGNGNGSFGKEEQLPLPDFLDGIEFDIENPD